MNKRWILVTLGAAALILAGCQTLTVKPQEHQLDAAEVRRLFSDRTVESYNRGNRLTSFTYYSPDGRVVQERLWRRRTGTWSVRDNGKICLEFSKRSCGHIVAVAGTYYKLRKEKSGTVKRLVRYRAFAPGNHLGAAPSRG